MLLHSKSIFDQVYNYINQTAKIGCIQEVHQKVKNLQNDMFLYKR